MKAVLFRTAVCSAFFLLLGCNAQDAQLHSRGVQSNQLQIPALPIIQDAVFELSDSLNQRRNREVMSLVCELAQTKKTQQQVNEVLTRQGVDLQALRKSADPIRILIDGDAREQAVACASFLAVSVLAPVDVSEFSTVSGVPASHGQAARTDVRIDEARLADVLTKKLGIAKANADVFALIAAHMQHSPGHTVKEYREQAKRLFARLAPAYLERMQLQTPATGTPVKLLQMDENAFLFTSAQGTVFEFARNGLVLRQNGIVWYGEGQLLGQTPALQIEYFPSSINALLSTAAGL